MWRPLVTEDRRAALADVIREIAIAVEGSPVQRIGEAFDRAVMRAYLAEGDVVPDSDKARKRLSLDVETVRVLASNEVALVAGGIGGNPRLSISARGG